MHIHLLNILKAKLENMINIYKNHTVEYLCLGMQDLDNLLK
jgi:hypothetical protein